MLEKMKLSFLALILIAFSSRSQETDSSMIQINNIENSLEYEKGLIELSAGNAQLLVPGGFKFLNRQQSIYVLTDLWGNPADSSILGMLVPENQGVLDNNSWVFTISYDEVGYIKDDDANDIDYDDLLKEQQEEFKTANPERISLGYPPIEFIGWASHPHYDSDKKILHWAKELKFGEDSLNTLNYNLRILGRKGMFMLNAIASMNELGEVEKNIDKIIGSVSFKTGSKYADFDPDVDEVAAWTIGGLVAGKVLAKAGFFVVLAKFWKVIALAFMAGGGAIWKFIKGKNKSDEQ